MNIQKMVDEIREQATNYFNSIDTKITDPTSVTRYLEAAMFCVDKKQFGVLYLNQWNRVIKFKVEFKGTVNRVFVYPREIAKSALECGAVSVIIAHNYPGGTNIPSSEDLELTKKLQSALNTLDIVLLDHIIVSKPGTSISLRDFGHI